ncbi:MAG: hypothetical protein IKV96_01125 [Firmicutes bacterium]|nr:hypothetical protein [Bacillota bacterium]
MKIFDLLMIIILIVTNLTVVVACWLTYRKNFRYEDGMMLGVHIPFEHAYDSDLTEFCKKKAKNWKTFNLVNLVAGCLVCLPGLYDWGLCIVLWTVWLVAYLVLAYYFMFKPHGDLMRIKKERGWFDETTKHKVVVDTKVSAVSDNLAPSWKWHIPIGLALVLTGIVSYGKTDGFSTGGVELIMLMISLAMCVMYAGMHISSAGKRNKVYSENSELNLQANKLHKRAWAWASLWSNILASIGGIYVIYKSVKNMDNLDNSMIVYCLLLTVSVVIMVYLVYKGEKKIKKLMENDDAPVYIDDDEYWKWGFYNNPNDSRIMLQNKWSKMNYTVNIGHPVGKAIMGVTAVLVIGLVIFTIWTFVALGNTETFFTVQDDVVTFDAFMYKYSVDVDDIDTIVVIDEMPDEHFSRVGGAATGKVSIGNYRGNETGKCKLFIHNDESPILMIKVDDMTVFANSTEDGAVESWYETIEAMR